LRRRVADTLAGGTLAALGGQRLLPARVLGLSALAAGMAVIAWGVLMRSGAGPTVHASSATRPSADLGAVSASAPSVPRPAPAFVERGVAPLPPAQPAPTAAKSVQPQESAKGSRPAPKPASLARPAASLVQGAPLKAAGVSRNTTIASKPVKPVAKKRIDREFGF
jgi:hypothetical protein